jgi:hypothetical protein
MKNKQGATIVSLLVQHPLTFEIERETEQTNRVDGHNIPFLWKKQHLPLSLSCLFMTWWTLWILNWLIYTRLVYPWTLCDVFVFVFLSNRSSSSSSSWWKKKKKLFVCLVLTTWWGCFCFVAVRLFINKPRWPRITNVQLTIINEEARPMISWLI